MTTEKPADATAFSAADTPVVSKGRRVFTRAFGIPGLICAIISLWFSVTQSLIAMTASNISSIAFGNIIKLSVSELINIPIIALCFSALIWACFGVVLSALSKALGVGNKINQAGMVLSIVSSVCSISLEIFTVIYILFT